LAGKTEFFFLAGKKQRKKKLFDCLDTMERGLLVIVEGNISSGKTSLVSALPEHLDGCTMYLEPTLTNPYLEDFYATPKQFALQMQLWLLRQRFKTIVESLGAVERGETVLLDRSVYSDWVFAEKNRIDGTISEQGFDYYMAIRKQMLTLLPPPDVAVYLDVEAAECHRRIHSVRMRDCESGIPLDYLSGLSDCYDAFIGEMKSSGAAVIRVDWNAFGDAELIASKIRGAAAECRRDAPTDAQRALVHDHVAIAKAMRPVAAIQHLADIFEDSRHHISMRHPRPDAETELEKRNKQQQQQQQREQQVGSKDDTEFALAVASSSSSFAADAVEQEKENICNLESSAKRQRLADSQDVSCKSIEAVKRIIAPLQQHQ
jgi:deoxyadenosine/deoxycytidine kinase